MPSKILLVEDEQLLRDSLAQLLSEEGFDVTQAADGRAGHEAALAAELKVAPGAEVKGLAERARGAGVSQL